MLVIVELSKDFMRCLKSRDPVFSLYLDIMTSYGADTLPASCVTFIMPSSRQQQIILGYMKFVGVRQLSTTSDWPLRNWHYSPLYRFDDMAERDFGSHLESIQIVRH